ncbi:hypothetical protein [Paenibacillus hexagrammi]|uniref:Uncharacterized protein n=1 Tax=Paenibacillus hexagrammi TaxID=2908839 RepID=A0ABY3SJ23_9BACL|nr:hypothetical protein [Paenibacillus sp. YPD9-1]UJF33216.1 hypothetical protein L0M14_27395 [Paenibacillus sp. YPD9-1]
MKILSVFIDMLRPNLMNVHNHEVPEHELDRFFRQLGGTLYTNCYTPAPDTARSMACFWSGAILPATIAING